MDLSWKCLQITRISNIFTARFKFETKEVVRVYLGR